MSERKWTDITVNFDDGEYTRIHRSDFEELKKIKPILEALLHARRMQEDINRLLGEVKE